MQMQDAIQLADWRLRIFDLYRQVRLSLDPAAGWSTWRDTRAALFRSHPQSPIPEPERSSFTDVDYHPYDPGARTLGTVTEASPNRLDIATSDETVIAFTRFGIVDFELSGSSHQLELYWVEGYGGGIFLPFGDATNGEGTYGGGRYLLDTVKGADLGMDGERLILDFNFAYNPSCSYDPRWVCPLTTPGNRLDVPITAGEMHDPREEGAVTTPS